MVSATYLIKTTWLLKNLTEWSGVNVNVISMLPRREFAYQGYY